VNQPEVSPYTIALDEPTRSVTLHNSFG